MLNTSVKLQLSELQKKSIFDGTWIAHHLSQTLYTLHESHAVRKSDSNGVDGNTIKHIPKLTSVLLAQGATTATYRGVAW